MSAVIDIAMGHRVMPEDLRSDNPYYNTTISATKLESYIKAKLDKGYQPIALDRLLDSPLPDGKYFALTFDDGYQDNYDYALPVLEKYNVPASIFICTSFADQRIEPFEVSVHKILRQHGMKDYQALCHKFKRGSLLKRTRMLKVLTMMYNARVPALDGNMFMDWHMIRELDKHPLITIGSHTCTHQLLRWASPWQLWYELKRSREILEERLGRSVKHLAYPYGGHHMLVRAMTKLAGYRLAVTTRPGVMESNTGNLFSLPRNDLNEGDLNNA